MKIVLIGFMGAGKSFVSENLAEKYDYKKVSLDEEIEKYADLKIEDIFEKFGERYFRNIEKQLLQKYLQEEDIIIDAGGGVAMHNKDLLKDCKIIYVKASFDIIWDRIKDTDRPLVKNSTKEEVNKLYLLRENVYEKLANEIIVNES